MTEENHGVEGLQEPRYYGWEKCDVCRRDNCCEPVMCEVQEYLPEDDQCGRCPQKNICIVGPCKYESITTFDKPKTESKPEKARVKITKKSNGEIRGKLVYNGKAIAFTLRKKTYSLDTGNIDSLDLQRRAAEAIRKVWKKWRVSTS